MSTSSYSSTHHESSLSLVDYLFQNSIFPFSFLPKSRSSLLLNSSPRTNPQLLSISKLLTFWNDFNRFVTTHPLGGGFLDFAWLQILSSSSPSSVSNEVGGEVPASSAGIEAPKKVLILMSDTGGGHRASAEAIKAAFIQEFGNEYQVFVTDLWTDHRPWPFNQLPRSYNFLVKHGTGR